MGFELSVKSLTIMRHAPSRANDAFAASKQGDHTLLFALAHITDHEMPLSNRAGAIITSVREWLEYDRVDHQFDAFYTSTMRRARETALGIDQDADWVSTSRLDERSWGTFGMRPLEQREEEFPGWKKLKKERPYEWAPPTGDGESYNDRLADYTAFLEHINMHHVGERVIAVGHGESTLRLRALVEGVPEEHFTALEKSWRLGNGHMVRFKPKRDIGTCVRVINPIDNHVTPWEPVWHLRQR